MRLPRYSFKSNQIPQGICTTMAAGAVGRSQSRGAFGLLSRAVLAWELLPKSQIWTVPQIHARKRNSCKAIHELCSIHPS